MGFSDSNDDNVATIDHSHAPVSRCVWQVRAGEHAQIRQPSVSSAHLPFDRGDQTLRQLLRCATHTLTTTVTGRAGEPRAGARYSAVTRRTDG
jgi:hypothetical protein